jgi:chromate transporter
VDGTLDPTDAMTGPRTSLKDLAALFLRLGVTGFGGPAAHIAMMEHEVVRRREWLTRQQFLDYLAAANLIPGPNSTELAIHLGHAHAGWPGLIVAGVAFITPAVLIVLVLAWLYVRYEQLPALQGLLGGVKPVAVAIIAQALWGLGRTAVRSVPLAVIGAAALVATLVGAHELVVLAASGLAMAVYRGASSRGRPAAIVAAAAATTIGSTVLGAAAAPAGGAGAWSLFLVFLKIGSVIFGSGYVLLAFLRADLVERLQWLSEQQLLDAIAVGQVTPGPVFTAATFVGYVLGGTGGAVAATVGIFLPAFVFVAISGPLVPWLRRSPTTGAALDGVVVASLALMTVVSWQLGRASLVSPLAIVSTMVSLVALVRYRVNSAWLMVAGALVGLATAWTTRS